MLEILTSNNELRAGRKLLKAWGVDFFPSRPRRAWARLQRTLGGDPQLHIPDWRKGWEIAKTIQFARERVAKDARIVDLGCSNSEVVWGLAKLGYSSLAGCDLDPYCLKGLFSDIVEYSVQNITHTDYPDSSCEAITCMSVIEHGIDHNDFFNEVRRLLKPGGYMILSTDYWPNGIETQDVRHFGLPWHVFSRQDLENFICLCRDFGLSPVGTLNWRTPQPLISWKNRRYSFAWLALERGH